MKNKNHEQDKLLLGHSLVGAAIGIKGQITPTTNHPYASFNYGLFTAKAIHEPNHFSDKDWVSGFSVGMGF
ncbi:hypothetical protein LU293_03450 [Moraxella nasovis]|uniref:hypothetical protein n=1 Tax=Moraxella nasovis TaxID=2904121 RepID=UPI001F60BAA2|nr:hypothetical protein [Moraxella nasovis]UNU73964.1 hypothetical protein LU293_03450 [Moraxella nasovis]